jgi:transposase
VNGLKIAYKGKPSYLSQSDKEEITSLVKSERNVGLAELAIHIESKYDVIYQSQESYTNFLKFYYR